MSWAYSRMARSLEKNPIRETLRTAFRAHSERLRNKAAAFSWASM